MHFLLFITTDLVFYNLILLSIRKMIHLMHLLSYFIQIGLGLKVKSWVNFPECTCARSRSHFFCSYALVSMLLLNQERERAFTGRLSRLDQESKVASESPLLLRRYLDSAGYVQLEMYFLNLFCCPLWLIPLIAVRNYNWGFIKSP